MFSRRIWIGILISVIASSAAFAQSSSAGTPASLGGRGQHGDQNASTEKAQKAQEEKAKNTISGQCIILAGNGNLDTSPCVNLTLTLDAGNGKDILNTRTNENGMFEFSAPADAKYKISATSRFYEVVSPKDFISGTHRFQLQLKQK
jgi:hypothetical protein